QGALAQACAESLFDTSVLASAEADVQVQGPAICLLLAALRSQGDPPSISTTLIHLSENSCPPSFRNWFRLWADCVPKIKSLRDEQRYDLAKIICDQEPTFQPILIELPILAQNLRAIAIEISQRRTFQERFNEDLDYAIQFGGGAQETYQTPVSSKFHPPPAYDETIPSPHLPPRRVGSTNNGVLTPPQSASLPLKQSDHSTRPSTNLEDHPALAIVRETLYASLADIVYSSPKIHGVLESKDSTDGELSKAYFASLCLAILNVSLSLVDLRTRSIKVVNLGRGFPSVMRAEDCPPHLQPLIGELFSIAIAAQSLAEEDDRIAIDSMNSQSQAHVRGIDQYTKIERLKIELECGANWETGPNSLGIIQRADSPTGNVRSTANRINGLALRVSQIESFRERERMLFEVLVPNLSQRQSSRNR
ncbi:hypothetical protein BY996DRAFT_4587957, partial [Phakopsora pachyrhizi]